MQCPPFERLFNAYEAFLLTDGFKAVTKCGLWDWLKTVPASEEFFFVIGPELDFIRSKVVPNEYTQASFAWMMHQMLQIARQGPEEYSRRHTLPPACPCRRAQGHTTGWCGVAGGGVPGCDH
jgi:hypothetical protein